MQPEGAGVARGKPEPLMQGGVTGMFLAEEDARSPKVPTCKTLPKSIGAQYPAQQGVPLRPEVVEGVHRPVERHSDCHTFQPVTPT